jgi:GT2 family glycosyltransferase
VIPNLIVPVLNRYDLLQRLLDSIDYPIGHVFIIDNGDGPSEVIEMPDTVTEVTYSPMPNNLGVSGSWNLGIKALPYDPKWLIVSNDAYFTEGALEEFSKAGNDEIVLSSNFPHWQAFSIGEGVIREVGLWDERIYPAYYEDDDYKRRCALAGVPVVADWNVTYDHVGSATVSQYTEERNKLHVAEFEANKARYSRKWGGEPGLERYSRPYAIPDNITLTYTTSLYTVEV